MLKVTKKNHCFKDLYFVTEALSKDTIKPVFCHLYADENKLIATDARRLHTMECKDTMLDDIEPGTFIEVIKRTKSEIILNLITDKVIGTFPAWKQIIPNKGDFAAEKSIKGLDFISKSMPRLSILTRKIFNILHEKNALNIDFLKPLDDKFDVYAGTDMSPVLFDNCTKQAVIMPMLMKLT